MSLHDKLVNLEPINLFEHKEEVPMLLSLETCQQSPTWHGEGNVLIHTNMALQKAHEELIELDLPYPLKLNIYLATLLHDIGKPEASFLKGDKIVAYDHGKMGVWKSREFLRKHFPEFNFARREWITSLVDFHMTPREMVKGNVPDKRYKRFSFEADTLEAYYLSKADLRGRIAKDVVTVVSQLDLYKAKCVELDMWGQPYTLVNSKTISRFGYNNIRWQVLFNGMDETNQGKIDTIENLMQTPPFELLIMIGAPGSGKTTYRQTHYPNVATICMDEYREKMLGDINDMTKNDVVFSKALTDLRFNMRNRINTIWDATSISRKLRRKLIQEVRNNYGLVGMVYFDLPLEILKARNSGRSRVVPDPVIEQFYKNLESPKPYEYDQLVVVEA